MAQSTLDLFVSGRNEELLMIEMKSIANNNSSNELSEDEMIKALSLAKNYIKNTSETYRQQFSVHKKPQIIYEIMPLETNESFIALLEAHYKVLIMQSIAQMAKSERTMQLEENIAQICKEQDIEDIDFVRRNVNAYKKQLLRSMILQDSVRADGRKLNEIRKISVETNILPFVHGSALFTRGQTQALVTATIGTENDAQSYENLHSKTALKKRFLFHYNFPPFSIGEAGVLGSVSRRELGHGNLAKKALESSIVDTQKTIRLVSEILESNGSSSMASVCGGSLALAACGIETYSLIAGVAMGLITDGEKFAILTDISGLEDHDGDMDFKVAGGYKGITAMQMDIKLGGISEKILFQALLQAKEAREHILSIMEEAKSRIILNEAILPKTESFNVAPHKIADIIGAGGKVIRDIIERFEVSIDIARDSGKVQISSTNKERIEQAKAFILDIVGSNKESMQEIYSIGEQFSGKIKKVMDFGVFVELPRGGDGMVHVSKFALHRRVDLPQLLEGINEIECGIIGFKNGKVELDVLPHFLHTLN